MAEQKMISEKEAVMRERAAFRLGARTYACAECREMMERDNGPAAAVRYPLPKVTRPRVVMDPYAGHFGVASDQVMVYWKVCGDNVVSCDSSGAVLNHEYPYQRAPLRVKLWADLLANPTEEVEDV